MERPRHDLAVIGGGIVGLAHAYTAVRRGLSVVLFERSPRAVGASVRNFGMIWPIGQSPGPALDRALRSARTWTEAAARAGFWYEPVGSLHVAYADDEWAVLREFAAASTGAGYSVRLLEAGEAAERSPGLVRSGLRGGLWSDTEACVDPRQAVARLTDWLAAQPGVTLLPATPVRAVDHPFVDTAAGDRWPADRIAVCSGDDLRTLYPEVYATSGLTRCKLQMMRTGPQAYGWRLGPMLAAGATLRHYRSFAACPSLDAVRRRFSAERPEFDRWGIHVMASQNGAGEVTLGDSHEYGDQAGPFDREEVDRAILDYLSTFLQLPSPAIAERWHGFYVKLMDGGHEFIAEPQPGVRIVNGPGGAGMTFSFGLAADVLDGWG